MLKDFLKKYDTVIFDMDGVMTSEQGYWNAAALTVWEYLKRNKNEQINSSECMENLKEIRKKVFCDDKLITVLKEKGVNSNWDLAYVTVCLAWICDVDEDFSVALEYAESMPENILNYYDELAGECSKKTGFDYEWLKRDNLMWHTVQGIFQEWYFGDKLFKKQYGYEPINVGKSGLIFKEEPLINIEILDEILKELYESDTRLCIATGRPSGEIIPHLDRWRILKYFAKDGLCNYDYVAEGEKALGTILTKPSPYMFLKALYGTDYSDEKIINGEYDKSKIKRTLAVGDAGADILAAQAMGADFCAVLTGVSGQKARGYFENLKSNYILDSLADFLK